MFATLPVNALRTFESAARLRSFKLAAAELAVTPTAISHQIKALEQQLGFALFERVPRGVRLTPKGETLFSGVHGALLDVAATLEGLRPQPSAGSLCVSVTHSFAALWLVPRLGRFYQAYPHYLVRLEACAEVIDLQQDASVDVAVRYSRAHYPALHQAARLEESFGVYAAPGLAAAEPENPVLITVKWGIRRCTTAAGMTGAGPPGSIGGGAMRRCAAITRSITPCRRRWPGKGGCSPAR